MIVFFHIVNKTLFLVNTLLYDLQDLKYFQLWERVKFSNYNKFIYLCVFLQKTEVVANIPSISTSISRKVTFLSFSFSIGELDGWYVGVQQSQQLYIL